MIRATKATRSRRIASYRLAAPARHATAMIFGSLVRCPDAGFGATARHRGEARGTPRSVPPKTCPVPGSGRPAVERVLSRAGLPGPTFLGVTAVGSVPPGWYPDAAQPACLRWWDGTQWTEHRTAAWQPPMAPPATHPAGTTDLTYLLPVNRDGFAIAAGYLGLLSLLPNPVTSVAAIVCGCLALRRVKVSQKLGRGRAWFGIVVGAISAALFVALVVAAAGDSSSNASPAGPVSQPGGAASVPSPAPASGRVATDPPFVDAPGSTVAHGVDEFSAIARTEPDHGGCHRPRLHASSTEDCDRAAATRPPGIGVRVRPTECSDCWAGRTR